MFRAKPVTREFITSKYPQVIQRNHRNPLVDDPLQRLKIGAPPARIGGNGLIPEGLLEAAVAEARNIVGFTDLSACEDNALLGIRTADPPHQCDVEPAAANRARGSVKIGRRERFDQHVDSYGCQFALDDGGHAGEAAARHYEEHLERHYRFLRAHATFQMPSCGVQICIRRPLVVSDRREVAIVPRETGGKKVAARG